VITTTHLYLCWCVEAEIVKTNAGKNNEEENMGYFFDAVVQFIKYNVEIITLHCFMLFVIGNSFVITKKNTFCFLKIIFDVLCVKEI
jgi:hypothetical protein